MNAARGYLAFLYAMALSASCTFKDEDAQCRVDDDCASYGARYTCHRFFCVKPAEGSGASGGTGAGGTSASGGKGGSTEPAGTGGDGAGGGGGNADREPCQEPDLVATCDIPSGEYDRNDGCKKGQRKCEGEFWSACTAKKSVEVCNGVDDDCDDQTDESTDIECFPTNTPGCVVADSGRYECTGACMPGKQKCVAGKPGECTGAKIPQAELCNEPTAADDDCNGQVDDGCRCTSEQTSQSCYTGPAAEIFPGSLCQAGALVCDVTTGTASCANEKRAVAETCENQGQDDNCNGVADDIPDLEMPCTLTTNTVFGRCRSGTLKCPTPAAGPALACVGLTPIAETCNGVDDDCDGMTDEPGLTPLCAGAATCSNGICVPVGGDDAGT